MNREEARERLLEVFFSLDHGDHCREADPHFVDEDAPRYPDREGCLVVECWNCEAQDHFLYDSAEEGSS